MAQLRKIASIQRIIVEFEWNESRFAANRTLFFQVLLVSRNEAWETLMYTCVHVGGYGCAVAREISTGAVSWLFRLIGFYSVTETSKLHPFGNTRISRESSRCDSIVLRRMELSDLFSKSSAMQLNLRK